MIKVGEPEFLQRHHYGQSGTVGCGEELVQDFSIKPIKLYFGLFLVAAHPPSPRRFGFIVGPEVLSQSEPSRVKRMNRFGSGVCFVHKSLITLANIFSPRRSV